MKILDLLEDKNPVRDRFLAYRETDMQVRSQLQRDIDGAFQSAFGAAREYALDYLLDEMTAVYSAIRGYLEPLQFQEPLPGTEEAVLTPVVDGAFHPVLGDAWRALVFIEQNEHQLNDEEQKACLSAVAAVQKIYRRTLMDVDPVQELLYRRLIRLSRGVPLSALRHGIPDRELEDIAMTLSAAVEAAEAAAKVEKRGAATPRRRRPQCRQARATIGTSVSEKDIHAARRITAGRRLLLVGGICKEEERERIERALMCTVEWFSARKGQNATQLATAAARCSLLVTIIRLSSHGHTEGLSDLSRRTGLPLVRVTAGFSPASIARAIRTQVSEAMS